ncbi:SusD/RagB family nutrient-binding outer membrane lipoprotein [soil metagenome]
MKIAKIFKISLLMTIVFVINACNKDFEEINVNPNEPESVTNPALLLPGILRNSMNNHYQGAWNRGTIVADHYENQFVSAFNWSPSDAEGYFLWTFFGHLRNVYSITEIAEKQNLNNYLGVSLVLKSYMFQSLTDIYGDIPYSEAIKAKTEGINFPKYDRQENIYEGILADLKRANELLGTTQEAIAGDILFQGNVRRWKMFANSLQLRCLARISKRKDPSAQMQEIVNNPEKYPLFQTYQDQAALQYLDELGNEFPRYRSQIAQTSTHITVNFETHLKNMNDPRLELFATPTPGTEASSNPAYFGVPNGIANPEVYNGGLVNQSPPGLLWLPLGYSPLTSPTAAESLLMTNAELQFILAEAAEKGWIQGDAEAFYLKGIKDNFDHNISRIPANFVRPTKQSLQPSPDYYTQPTVAYTGSKEEKLQKIYLQKWISLFNVGFEAWSEWRRTGYPEIVPGPNSIGFIPRRHPYAGTEQGLNPQNYDEAVRVQGADNISTRVWWDME